MRWIRRLPMKTIAFEGGREFPHSPGRGGESPYPRRPQAAGPPGRVASRARWRAIAPGFHPVSVYPSPRARAAPCAPRTTVRRCAQCAISTASLRASKPSATSPAPCATSRATCRCCRASFPIIPLRSSAPRWTASVNSRLRAGACRRQVRHGGPKVRPGRHQYPQRRLAPLAPMARRREPLRRSVHELRRGRD